MRPSTLPAALFTSTLAALVALGAAAPGGGRPQAAAGGRALEFTEPPERVAVAVGDARFVLAPGEESALPDGTPVTASVLGTRVFGPGSPFTFEYPRGWRFSGAGGAGGAWWSLAGDGALVSVRRTSGDAASAVAAYVGGVQGGKARDVVAVERELDGVLVHGARCRAPGLSMRGGPEGDWIVEVLGFSDPRGRTWVVALHRQLSVASMAPSIELVPVDGVLEPTLRPPAERDPAAATMDAVAASWRWRE